jgi:ABC-type branched-subunit amino acid transport system ATPase component
MVRSLRNEFTIQDLTPSLCSLGLGPAIVEEVFARIRTFNQTGTTVLLVEQNARKALSIADRAYVLEQGKNALTGAGKALLHDPQVKRLYLGG